MTHQKVAAVDVCDVAVALHQATLRTLNLSVPDHPTNWDLKDAISDYDWDRVLKLWNQQEFWRTLPPIAGVHEGIEGLKSQGYQIHWITSPWHSCKDWEGIRRAWLVEQKLIDDVANDITFTTQKFRFSADVFIDDRPKHVKSWAEHHPGKSAYLFNSKFNRYFSWEKRVIWSPEGIRAVELY